MGKRLFRGFACAGAAAALLSALPAHSAPTSPALSCKLEGEMLSGKFSTTLTRNNSPRFPNGDLKQGTFWCDDKEFYVSAAIKEPKEKWGLMISATERAGFELQMSPWSNHDDVQRVVIGGFQTTENGCYLLAALRTVWWQGIRLKDNGRLHLRLVCNSELPTKQPH